VDSAQGIVDQIVAVYGNVDLGKDRIHPGAFTKTIAERGLKIRVLDQHNTNSIMCVIGKPLGIKEVGRDELPQDLLSKYPDATGGLWTSTQYLMDTPEGKGAFSRIAAGAVDEASIGYDALDINYTKEVIEGKQATVRNIKTIRLWEYSPVIWGMNPATTVVSSKDIDPNLEDDKGAIPIHRPECAEENETWSAPALKDFTTKSWGELSDAQKTKLAKHYAFSANVPPEKFGDLKLPHHRPSDMAVVWNGVRNAASRLSHTQGLGDSVEGVRAHLAAHYKQFGKVPPWQNGKKAVDFDALFTQRQVEEALSDNMWDMKRALEDAISGILCDEGMTAEQKVSMLNDSLDQFKIAILAHCSRVMSVMAQAAAVEVTQELMTRMLRMEIKENDEIVSTEGEAGPGQPSTLGIDEEASIKTLETLEADIRILLLEETT
jgi:HK97 family phage prohead protease